MPEPAAAILLAAGASTRLGRPKQLVLYRGEPLLRRAALLALTAGAAPVFVVADPAQPDILAVLEDLPVRLVHAPEARAGMNTSVRRGLHALQTDSPEMTRVLLLVCDQPLLRSEHLRALLAAPGSVAAAHYDGRLGVPAVFAREHFAALAAIKGDQGARGLLRGLPVTPIPIPEAAFDVDTSKDLFALENLDSCRS